MAIPQPGLATTVPGISEPLIPAGTVVTDGTLTGDGSSAPLSVVQNYALLLGSFLAAGLPDPTLNLGALAIVTDSSVILWGTAVAGGGAATVLVWSNGTNWTVLGI
jgi:hypothetical protein